MGNILGLKRGDAIQNINDLGYQLFETAGLKFTKNRQLSIVKAGTYRDDSGYATEVEIGTNELEYVKDGKFHFIKDSIEISDEMFVRVVLNMYHEQAHCFQKNELFRQSGLDGQAENQLVQELACNASREYYYGEINYRLNANEIQAEKEGILGVHEYLCNIFPNVDAKDREHIILNIVNDKMRKSSYFVERAEPFTSLQEVVDAFDDAYDNSFNTMRRFIMENEPKDPVKMFMNDHEDAKEMYCRASTAVEQDRCIAAIALRLHPEWLEQYQALQHLNLSYENVIAKPYREIKECEEHALHAKEEEMDAVVKGKANVEPVEAPGQKHYDKKDMKGLSRAEQLDMMFGHIIEDESVKTAEDGYEKE